MHETAWRRGCFPWERGRNSKFSRFYSRLISAHSDLLEVSGSDKALFPGALPYPEVFADEGGGIAGESNTMRWSMSFLNAWVAWSNFVVLGSPDSVGTAQEPRVKYRCQKEMRAFTDDLLGEVVEFFDKSGFCTASFQCDGKRRTLEEAIEACRDLHGSYTIPGVVSGEKPVSTAIPVVASRVAIPEQAGTVELADWLPPERQQVVSDLSKLRQPEHLWDEVVPAFHNVPFEEEEDDVDVQQVRRAEAAYEAQLELICPMSWVGCCGVKRKSKARQFALIVSLRCQVGMMVSCQKSPHRLLARLESVFHGGQLLVTVFVKRHISTCKRLVR